MRLLVTNDDGIESVFLHELARALLAAGHEVFVVAPRSEQSWTGASKSRHRAVHSAAADAGLGCPTWSVDGTPSDSVSIALDHLLPSRPDAVMSGINVGLNASLAFIMGSGTVAGALEGALNGIPGVAFSQSLPEPVYDDLKSRGGSPDPGLLGILRSSAAHAARMGPELAASTGNRSFIVHNVNFPHRCHAGTAVRRTVPARTLLPGLFSPKAADGMHRLVFRLGDDISPMGLPTDSAALAEGYISHTVLDFSKLGSI
ncbi:MAG TPA: 5'/3'-nucleotidase SurE [Opitutaceae bacterium]